MKGYLGTTIRGGKPIYVRVEYNKQTLYSKERDIVLYTRVNGDGTPYLKQGKPVNGFVEKEKISIISMLD